MTIAGSRRCGNLIPERPTRQCKFGNPGQLRPRRPNTERKAVDHTKRRIEITVEKRRLVVLSRRNHSINVWCETCGQQVQMVTPDEAAQLCRVSTRTIYRRVETGRLHFTETEKGASLICLQSLESKANSTQGGRSSDQPLPGVFQEEFDEADVETALSRKERTR